MATARRLLVDPAGSGVYHCISRCVRRAFLCGRDGYSGRDYEHRRAWIRDRLRELACLYAVEIHAYAVMSNHLHLVPRTLPGQVAGWSDDEAARRWLRLFPPLAADPPPLLPHLSAERYLELLDWTGRQIRAGKRGHIDPQLRPLLERLELDLGAWVANVESYGALTGNTPKVPRRNRHQRHQATAALIRHQTHPPEPAPGIG